MLQEGDPVPDIFGVLEFLRNGEGRREVRRPQFRDQFFGGIGSIPEASREIAIQAAFVSRPMGVLVEMSGDSINCPLSDTKNCPP